jgi:hypothetical protein
MPDSHDLPAGRSCPDMRFGVALASLWVVFYAQPQLHFVGRSFSYDIRTGALRLPLAAFLPRVFAVLKSGRHPLLPRGRFLICAVAPASL